MFSTVELTGISIAMLGESVGNIRSCRDEIIAALDVVFTGFEFDNVSPEFVGKAPYRTSSPLNKEG